MAKKFKFRAEAVLRMREHAEKEALRKMGDAQRKVNAIQQRIGDLREEMADQDKRVRQGVLTGSVDVQYMSLYRTHLMALHRRLIEMGGELHQAATELARERAVALEAVKQRKVLDKLKDKQRQRHVEELDKEELRQVDDMTLMRIGRHDGDRVN